MGLCGSMRDDADKTILIRNQQVRGSSPRAGFTVFNNLQKQGMSPEDTVSPLCHHIDGARQRLRAPVRDPSDPHTPHRGMRENPPTPHAPVAQLDRASAFQDDFPGFYSKPRWFYDGVEQYEGFVAVGSPNVWRLAAEKTYNDNAISCGQGLTGEEVSITEPYAAGATYFRFLADRFGEQIHIDMLRDSRANASQILADLSGESPCETFDHFRNWMHENYGLGEPVP